MTGVGQKSKLPVLTQQHGSNRAAFVGRETISPHIMITENDVVKVSQVDKHSSKARLVVPKAHKR